MIKRCIASEAVHLFYLLNVMAINNPEVKGSSIAHILRRNFQSFLTFIKILL